MVQVPSVPARLQASQAPTQAVSQQTPSTQWPVPHWAFSAHTPPCVVFGTQAPLEHIADASQSRWLAQVELQAVAPHANGAQAVVCSAGHAPAPSQVAAAVAVPASQDAPRHEVAAVGYVHAAVVTPLQAPPQAEPSEAHAVRPTGAPTTGVQVPAQPAWLQASH